jgi:FkbM family methyltransferase
MNSSSLIVFDAGALGGFREIPTLHKRIQLHAFEPQRNAFIALQKQYISANPFLSVRVNELALAEKVGNAIFYQTSHSSMASLLMPDKENFEKNFGQMKQSNFWLAEHINKTTYEVKTETIDEYASREKVDFIDLLKLDTQGTEYRILQGAENLLRAKKISVIKTEVNFVPIYKDQCYFSDIDKLLRSYGYLYVDCKFYTDVTEAENTFAWRDDLLELTKRSPVGDAIYVLDFMPDESNRAQVANAADILTAMGFYSNAHDLLKRVLGFSEVEIRNRMLPLAKRSFTKKLKQAIKRYTPPAFQFWISRLRKIVA